MSSQNCPQIACDVTRSPFFPFCCKESVGECVSVDLNDFWECQHGSPMEQSWDENGVESWEYAPREMCK